MSRVLASHQPDFFPYMGYFYKMFQSDLFVFSDNVQYSKSGRHNYNDILTGNGRFRMTLPINRRVANLNEIEIAASGHWCLSVLKTLRMEYHRAAHFNDAYTVLEGLLLQAPGCSNLAEFNLSCLMHLAELFGLTKDREFLNSSDLYLENRKDARIIEMCQAVGADVYYSGPGAKDYHIEEDYAKAGIRLVYSDYQSEPYPQIHGGWEENLSVIDYVMNCGFELPRGWRKHA